MEVIVEKNIKMCGEITNAIIKAGGLLKTNCGIYALDSSFPNNEIVKKLKKEKVRFVSSIEEVPEGNKLIIGPNGCAQNVYEDSSMKLVSLVDLTCSSVAKIHDLVTDLSMNGYYIILAGDERERETADALSYCYVGDKCVAIKNERGLDALLDDSDFLNSKKVAMLCQSNFPYKVYSLLKEMLEKRIAKDVELKICDTMCDVVWKRQSETDLMASNVDAMVIVGDKESFSVKQIHAIASMYNIYTQLVESDDEILYNNYAEWNRVGVMSSPSTPQESALNVVKVLKKRSE